MQPTWGQVSGRVFQWDDLSRVCADIRHTKYILIDQSPLLELLKGKIFIIHENCKSNSNAAIFVYGISKLNLEIQLRFIVGKLREDRYIGEKLGAVISRILFYS
jgi:hypothetical protein